MTASQPPNNPPPPPSAIGVRYSLPEMLAELKLERATGAFGMEKLDQSEIGKLFKPQPRRRAKSKK